MRFFNFGWGCGFIVCDGIEWIVSENVCIEK